MKRVLKDTMLMEGRIVEADKNKLPPGVLLRVEGLAQRCGVKNANGRIYPKEVWEDCFGDKTWLGGITEGSMVGEADHPASNEPSIVRASHVVREVKWGGGEPIDATFDILDTPSGRILETLFKAGVKVGVSSRGDGSTTQSESGEELVEKGYRPSTWDFVLNPSTGGAYPTPITEGLSTPRHQRAILESLRSTVNSNPSREDLLECYQRVQSLAASDPVILTERDRLAGEINQRLNQGGYGKMPNELEFMKEAVTAQFANTLKPLEERVRFAESRTLDLERENTALRTQIKESGDWKKRHDELASGVGDVSEARNIRTKYEAARTKVIPGLIAENDKLNRELSATKQLLQSKSTMSERNRIAAYIESALAHYPARTRASLRLMLENCASAVDVDRRLRAVDRLGVIREQDDPKEEKDKKDKGEDDPDDKDKKDDKKEESIRAHFRSRFSHFTEQDDEKDKKDKADEEDDKDEKDKKEEARYRRGRFVREQDEEDKDKKDDKEDADKADEKDKKEESRRVSENRNLLPRRNQQVVTERRAPARADGMGDMIHSLTEALGG